MFAHRPRTINRAALIVRPKQPYVDWANSVDDEGPRAILQELRTDPSIYLVEIIDSLEDSDLLVGDPAVALDPGDPLGRGRHPRDR